MGCNESKFIKTTELFKCDIIPISQAYPCNETYDEEMEVKTMFYRDDRLYLFNDYECTCVALANSNTLTTAEVVDVDIQDSIYCVSSKNGNVYCVERDEDRIHRVRVKERVDKVQLVSSKGMFLTTTRCYGIACFDGGLALLVDIGDHFQSPSRHVQYVTSKGKIKQQIYKKPDGGFIFTNPSHIASNVREDILYVSDTDHVLVFDVKGDILKCITLHDSQPRDITSDPEGNFYVVCGDRLLQFNQRYHHRVLLNVADASSWIGAVAWINPSRSLAVMQGDVLLIFKMAPALIPKDSGEYGRQWTPVMIGGDP